MIQKKVLGHIDCPSCGTAGGLRITHDKNGHPFGFCEATCNQQIRIGGDARRVAAFVARYPWAAGTAPAEPNKATPGQLQDKPAPARPVAKVKEQKQVLPPAPAAPVTAPAPAPVAKPRSAFDDALKFLSGAGA